MLKKKERVYEGISMFTFEESSLLSWNVGGVILILVACSRLVLKILYR